MNCEQNSLLRFLLCRSVVIVIVVVVVVVVVIVIIIFNTTSITTIIVIIRYVCLLSQTFLPGTSLEPAVIPTAQSSSFTLQYFPYYV